MVSPDNIPTVLRERPNWLLWRVETCGDRKNAKIPYTITGAKASVSDPETWASFDEAYRVYRESGSYSGIGFVFDGQDIFGVDLDGCLADGKLADWAGEFLKRYPTYAEVSPSRTGIKLFYRGTISQGKKVDLFWKPSICEKRPAIEVYNRGRYFAVTGWRWGEINDLRTANTHDMEQRVFACSLSAVKERARRYVAKIPPAVSGQGGHNRTFYAACILVDGFALPREDALELLRDYNKRCQPPWSESDLLHKVDSAIARTTRRGYLLGWTEQELATKPLPEYKYVIGATVTRSSLTKVIAERFDEVVENRALLLTGITDIDDALGGGVELGEMVVVAGRPGHGKSAFALQFATELCAQGLPVLYISEEMGQVQIARRLMLLATDIPRKQWIERKEGVSADLEYFWQNRAELFVVESCGDVGTAIAAIEDAVAKDGVRAVVVDYVQLLRSGKRAGRYEDVTDVSIALRQTATKHKILMVALCQLNRAIEGRESQTVSLSDIRDSGQIEQDADVVLFVVHPWKLRWSDDPVEFRVHVLKNRNRAIAATQVICTFEAERQRFSQWSGSRLEEGKTDDSYAIPF